jgi:hypothetical protein
MILFSLCNSCLQPFQIRLEMGEVHLMKQIVDADGLCMCPRLCGGKINLVQEQSFVDWAKDPRLKPEMTMSGKELFQAVNGMGLPDEIPKDPVVLEALLLATPLTSVVIEGDDKSIYLHELHLANGVVIHLTSGQRGARVMKVTKGVASAKVS